MDGILALAGRQAWAQEQFGAADLGDARRTRRLVKVAAQAAGNSNGSLPQQTGCAADMKAAYRLFANPEVTHDAVIGAHLEQTRQAAGQRPLVFLVQDTMELNYTSHSHCEGLGLIGHGEGMRGLHQQNVLAIDPFIRRPLGLMYQKHHCWTPRSDDHDRKAMRAVPLEERASHWWIEAIRTIGSPPLGVRWVQVGDRGEDIFGVYDEARRVSCDWLIRASKDRCVLAPGGEWKLFAYARSLTPVHSRTLQVRCPTKNTLRQATLHLAAGAVELLPSRYEPAYRDRQAVVCQVVRVWEKQPPQGVEPLEWLLLTSLPCETQEHLQFVADGYALRWMIEEFHKCQKTGCNVEMRRLEHVDRLEPLIGLLSVLAVWLLQLKFAVNETPERPARDVFDETTVKVMARYLKRPAQDMTLGDFWRGVGLLGGHMGRKCDGKLGWLRAWKGWQAFQLILLGAVLATEDG